MIHHATKKRFRPIVSALLEWHRRNRRSFIWRSLERSPYVVLVSEFMLQQTGVKQVEKHLPDFLQKFPTVQKLASAPQSEVVKAWHGLGYNRRAINLHRAAKAIASMPTFPETLDNLHSLPGIGLYTANAIMAFAHNANVAVVDVNIERVLSRLWKKMPDAHSKLPIPDIYKLDEAILPHGKSSKWHEGIMDLGSTICTKNRPQCIVCPLREHCPSKPNMILIPLPKQGNEKNYFGQPRRIWRGRILKTVADKEPVTERILVKLLLQKHDIQETAVFVTFVLSILTILIEEGFLTRTSKGAYRLAEHE